MIVRPLFAGFVCAVTALAHYTWIASDSFQPGKTATIRIGHGHKFPASEEAIAARQIDGFVLSPSGAKVKLQAAASAGVVTASFAVKEAGVHRIAFVQDRGVTSRTPAGVKPGGRDKNPNASQASRTLRTAVGYAGGAPKTAQPVGLELEICAGFENGAWSLQVLKQGKPAAGVAVEVFVAGAAKAAPAGTTAADGRLSYRASKGPLLFAVEFKEPAPAGSTFDATNYETSLYVSW